MNNSITVSLEFYFKGVKHTPSMVLDLNTHIKNKSDTHSLYALLAKSNNIDLYSYEYEMMLPEDFIFSDASGLASTFLEGGKFDFAAFEQALHDESLTEIISTIASDYLSVDDICSQPKLKAALLEAFKLGQKSCS